MQNHFDKVILHAIGYELVIPFLIEEFEAVDLG